MTAQTPARRAKPRLLGVIGTVAGLIILVGTFGLLRGDDDGLGEVRGLRGVATATERTDAGKRVEVVLRDGATADQIVAILRDFPKTDEGSTRRGTLKLGDAQLQIDGSAERAIDMAPALPSAASIAQPGQTIVLPSGSGASAVKATVPERSDAIPLARAAIDALAPKGFWPGGLRGLFIEVPGGYASRSPVSLGLLGSKLETAKAVLKVAADSSGSDPEVGANAQRIELRVLARSVDGAGEAWRSTVAALGSEARNVELYVDLMQRESTRDQGGYRGDGQLRRRPILFGRASDSPVAGIALLDKLAAHGIVPAVKTDRSFAQVTVDEYDAARGAAADADAASVTDFKLTWLAESNGPGVIDLPTVLTDRPSVVRGLLGGVQAAVDDFTVSWGHTGDLPKLSVMLRGPDAEAGAKLTGEEARRKLMTQVRGIGWPGKAEVRIPIGPGTCNGSGALATVLITSTRDGRATDTRVGSACTDRDDLAGAEEDWNASPAREDDDG